MLGFGRRYIKIYFTKLIKEPRFNNHVCLLCLFIYVLFLLCNLSMPYQILNLISNFSFRMIFDKAAFRSLCYMCVIVGCTKYKPQFIMQFADNFFYCVYMSYTFHALSLDTLTMCVKYTHVCHMSRWFFYLWFIFRTWKKKKLFHHLRFTRLISRCISISTSTYICL